MLALLQKRAKNTSSTGRFLFLLLSALALHACTNGLVTGGVAAGSGPNPGVYPTNSIIFGKTYAEWSAEHWKFMLGVPADINPIPDLTGANCAVDQSGPVWFLFGTTGDPQNVDRTCTIPAGTALFFPITDSLAAIPFDGATEPEIRTAVKAYTDPVTALEATIDGVPLTGVNNYRVQSPFFTYTMPIGPGEGLFPSYAGTHEAISDGWFIMLEPLSPGSHTVSFHGKTVFPAVFPNVSVFETSATYHLTVQ